MKILEHDLNVQLDGMGNKLLRVCFIKYQIELLNQNGYDIGIVFKMEADPAGFYEESDYYDYFNKTHDFELTVDEVGDNKLETIQSYGIYDHEHSFDYALKNSKLRKPIATEYFTMENFIIWKGELINSIHAYNSKFYTLAKEIYNDFDRPEWCIHIRDTDKYDVETPIPINVICNKIEELGIERKPFFVMTDSNVIMNELVDKYENIKYFQNHYRSDNILPIHCLWGVREWCFQDHIPLGEQQKQMVIEILVQLLCDKLLYTIPSGPVHYWYYSYLTGYKNAPIELWGEIARSFSVNEFNEFTHSYQKKIRELFDILWILNAKIKKQ